MSLIFSTVACNATLALHICYVNYISPFPCNVSLGRLWSNDRNAPRLTHAQSFFSPARIWRYGERSFPSMRTVSFRGFFTSGRRSRGRRSDLLKLPNFTPVWNLTPVSCKRKTTTWFGVESVCQYTGTGSPCVTFVIFIFESHVYFINILKCTYLQITRYEMTQSVRDTK